MPIVSGPVRAPFTLLAVALGLGLVVVFAGLSFFTATVDTGHVGIVSNFGRVTGEVLDAGWHLVGPTDHVTNFSIRTITAQNEAACFSKDLQQVTVTIAAQTRVVKTNAARVFQTYGVDYMSQAQPKIYEELKAQTARYDAAELIANREQIRNEVIKAARERLKDFVELEDVSLVNITFSSEYEKAIEAKQVAQQRAEQAKYELQQAEVEAEKKVAQARGEAQAIQIRGDALAKNPAVIQLEIVQKWDGKTPQTLVTSGAATGTSILLPLK
jgi:prohibitin 2